MLGNNLKFIIMVVSMLHNIELFKRKTEYCWNYNLFLRFDLGTVRKLFRILFRLIIFEET